MHTEFVNSENVFDKANQICLTTNLVAVFYLGNDTHIIHPYGVKKVVQRERIQEYTYTRAPDDISRPRCCSLDINIVSTMLPAPCQVHNWERVPTPSHIAPALRRINPFAPKALLWCRGSSASMILLDITQDVSADSQNIWRRFMVWVRIIISPSMISRISVRF